MQRYDFQNTRPCLANSLWRKIRIQNHVYSTLRHRSYSSQYGTIQTDCPTCLTRRAILVASISDKSCGCRESAPSDNLTPSRLQGSQTRILYLTIPWQYQVVQEQLNPISMRDQWSSKVKIYISKSCRYHLFHFLTYLDRACRRVTLWYFC